MLTDLKKMLGLDAGDTSCDERLSLIISSTTARLKNLLGGIDPPEEMTYIILEVSIVRYNRIGSEGMASHAVEGESHQFGDSDFSGFMDEIQAWLERQESGTRGRLRFL